MSPTTITAVSFAEGSQSFSLPTGTTEGDFLLWYVGCREAESISTPSGWTAWSNPIVTGGDVDVDVYIFYKFATAGDVTAGSVSIDVSDGSGQVGGVLMRYEDIDTVTPLEQKSADADTAGSAVVSLTPSFANSGIVAVVAYSGTNAISGYASTGTPTWTERFEGTEGVTSDSVAVATAPLTTTTEVTSFTFSVIATRSDVELLIVRPKVDGDGSLDTDNVTVTSQTLDATSSSIASLETDAISVIEQSVDATTATPTRWTEPTKSTDNWTTKKI